MGKLLRTSLLLPLLAATARANPSCVEAVSWGDPRVDLFGIAPDRSIWHKFYTGYDWQPDKFERIAAEAGTCPSVSSWGPGRFDIVWIDASSGHVAHKYFDGGAWGPDWQSNDNLGGNVVSVRSNSWSANRLDIVGLGPDGAVKHKAWTGNGWFPEGLEWENLGGQLSSLPNVVSWGPNRLDIVGTSSENGTLLHKYWDGYQWNGWEDLGGGPFIGNPTATSWGSGSLDIWAVDRDGVLHHKFWDGVAWRGWERMGGKFKETPQVVHFTSFRTDIVGKDADDNKYYLKTFNGAQWSPTHDGWYDMSGPYSSEPRLITKTEEISFLYLFGVDTENIVRLQIWSGVDWQPSAHETWPLGDLSNPYPTKGDSYLLGNEL
ncbi:hypothetical protein GGR50DRAFT_444035 [Xylaria sp. CBS 124048]|nr:hypothetical protein GGR50DRAFT_444035 [Xylaria sp. CBS 124048]